MGVYRVTPFRGGRAAGTALPTLWVAVVAVSATAWAGSALSAEHPEGGFGGGFDDPKLTREMGSTRLLSGTAPSGTAPSGRAVAPRPPVDKLPLPTGITTGHPTASMAATGATPAPPAPPAPPSSPVPRLVATPHGPAPAPSKQVPGRLAMLGDASDASPSHPSADIVKSHQRPPSPELAAADTTPPDLNWSYFPRMKLAYRHFSFARVASSVPSITPGTLDPTRPESFESVSLEFYPISSYLRVGLSTQFGWESGMFDRTGDYFFAESATVGFQWPGRFTPFLEGLAGGGYMRRQRPDGDLPAAYWQVGIDAGVEIYFARRAYLSLAAGYLHPANLLLIDQNLRSVRADTWSLKIGLGI